MKRFRSCLSFLTLAAVLAAAFCSPPAEAKIKSERLFFRTTTAASSYALQDWVDPQGTNGFADSSVFRQVATATNEDTTMAYPIERFRPSWPPDQVLSVGDTTGTPWIVLTIVSQATEYSWSGTNALDSIYVAAQVSVDGTTWVNVDGTPRREYFAATVSPIDGNPCLVAIEQATGANFASVLLKCEPGISAKADRLIIDTNLCAQPGWVRFIVSTGAGTGQFALIATYQD